mmetsp:Transcript_20881/g.42568  ORF Transcript_20881/g.42568 Transcript_20881/m.42568 type:complete len:225 (+) Transcript_20881:245-919(+)
MSSFPLQIITGILCASYWRGSWYFLDHTLFPENRFRSGVVSLASGITLLGMKQYILSPSYNGTKQLVRVFPPPKSTSLRTRYLQTNRFIVLYGISSACVLLWRGTWLLWDEAADSVNNLWRRSPQSQIIQRQSQLNIDILRRHSISEETGDKDSYRREDEAISEEQVLFYSGIASHVFATVTLLYMGRFASVMAPPANVSMMRDFFIHERGKSFARVVRSFTNH